LRILRKIYITPPKIEGTRLHVSNFGMQYTVRDVYLHKHKVVEVGADTGRVGWLGDGDRLMGVEGGRWKLEVGGNLNGQIKHDVNGN